MIFSCVAFEKTLVFQKSITFATKGANRSLNEQYGNSNSISTRLKG